MADKPKDRVALYMRVSTEEQAKEGIGLAVQEDRLRAQARAKDWQISKVFVDEGYSGKDLNRPGMKNLLDISFLKRINKVLILKVDHLSRKSLDFLTVFERFQEHSVELVSVDEFFDTSTAAGRMFMKIIADFAEYERELISERTLGAMRHLKAIGKPVGVPPYGYKVGEESGSRDPDQKKLKQVERIYRLALKGGSPRTISEKLKMNVSLVRRILQNPIYAGKTYEFGERDSKNRTVKPEDRGELIDAPWAKAVVKLKDWKKVQRIFAKRKKGIRYQVRGSYELTGIIKCSICHRSFQIHKEKDGRLFWRCSAKYRKSAGGCKEPTIGNKRALGIVYAMTRAKMADEGFIPHPIDVAEKLVELRDRERVIEDKRQKFIDAYENDVITQSDLNKRLTPLNKEKGEVHTTIQGLEWDEAQASYSKDFIRYRESFERIIEEGTHTQINEVLKAVWPAGITLQNLLLAEKHLNVEASN